MTRLLHIETATKVCSVALSEDGKLVDVLEESSGEYIHSEKLTIFIEEICKRNHWNLQDLQGIVVTSGPGSYTGLRIGVSTAKGLCFGLDIPLISVNTLESITQLALIKYPDAIICAMIDARRMEVFSGIYDNQMRLVKPLSADILDDNSYAEFEPFVVCGDGAEKVQTLWPNRNITVDITILSSASGQVQIAYQKYLNQEFEDVAYFEPKYLKDFMVTTAKSKL
ncbi:MAG: tRNA (adenosine(37)-N6)-threonylcarbamoyltransferase complex dimerization subunit type 1 TsaB [Brumimicrobium sp.]|nr:tRNA (adenosine(37)-N6)-threonylcarbamoyltransferase complex dimerization subunit type 1 TsaB [Brumimicrobium sp.]MCO5269834.1 tRNA (adenosine(37)-N6)-threonylcarbamoyltransferase complex dimerization subunit type 1 TsaB [Brumimicrobium sp.]